MFKSINIQNFQGHKLSEIKFSPGINIIIGLSNSGKSSVIRAFDLVFKNRPLGDRYIKDGEIISSVEVESEGVIIKRIKGCGKNSYIINEEDLSSSGCDPPPQVISLLKIGGINVQRQFSPYFLVFDSPGSVAGYIREITKSDEIDKILGVLTKSLRSVNTNATTKKERLEEFEKSIKSLESIELDELSDLINEHDEITVSLSSLTSTLLGLKFVVQEVQEIKQIIIPDDVDNIVLEASDTIKLVSDSVKSLNDLTEIVSSIINIKDINVPVQECEDLIKESNSITQSVLNLDKEIESIMCIVEDVKSNESGITEIDKTITLEIKIRSELMEKLDKCPTCGQELDEERIKIVCGNHQI